MSKTKKVIISINIIVISFVINWIIATGNISCGLFMSGLLGISTSGLILAIITDSI